jgi:hypothetical protein
MLLIRHDSSFAARIMVTVNTFGIGTGWGYKAECRAAQRMSRSDIASGQF